MNSKPLIRLYAVSSEWFICLIQEYNRFKDRIILISFDEITMPIQMIFLENHLKIPDFSPPSELSESDEDESSTLEDLELAVIESLSDTSPSLVFDLGPEEIRIPFQWTTAVVKI